MESTGTPKKRGRDVNEGTVGAEIGELQHPQIVTTDKLILDACCGGRMFWFDKENPNTLYVDNRTAPPGHIGMDAWKKHKVEPDMLMDFRDLKFADKTFKLVVFDPPHLVTLGEKSYMRKKYGALNTETWPYDLGKGFDECWRVLADYGVLVFKWNESEIPLKRVLECFKQKPLFGHPTAAKGKTYWCVFMKIPEAHS